jgi:hypothetical protein
VRPPTVQSNPIQSLPRSDARPSAAR